MKNKRLLGFIVLAILVGSLGRMIYNNNVAPAMVVSEEATNASHAFTEAAFSYEVKP